LISTKDLKLQVNENTKTTIVLKVVAFDNDGVTFSITKNPLHGKIVSFNPKSGKVTYIPNNNFVGNDVFSFKASNSNGITSDESQVLIKVLGALLTTTNIRP